MLMLNSSFINTPVMSLQNGNKLGSTTDPIIDPRKLQIVAFKVVGTRIFEESVLHSADIREVGPLGLIVNAADDIMPLDQDLVRLNEVINLHFDIIGKTVIDDNKRKLGKVSEFSVDTESFMIIKIHVSQSIMKNLSNTALIIDRSQVKEITDKSIIVRSASIKESSGLAQMLNPFRKSTGSVGAD
jgi:uncharacterized protein YrrD